MTTDISRRTVLLGVAATSVLGTAVAAAAPAHAKGGDATGDKRPIFDFTDAFYASNGVAASGLVGRRNGIDGASVVDTAPDRNHRDVRSTFTLPGYDHSGNEQFFTVLADLGPNAFTPNGAGRAARALAEASPVYVFPTQTGDPTGVGNSRQADLLDMRHGYYSNNPLGLWVHIFVTWTAAASGTAAGQSALASLAARNGSSLDGTPIIRTLSDIDQLTANGYVLQTKRPTSAVGRYFVCPAFKDPRGGAIAREAFLATVRRPDGSPLPAEQQFVTDFQSLQATGDYPR